MIPREDPLLFGLHRSVSLADDVARCLELPRSPHEERDFEDGEHKSRPMVSVRGRDVYVFDALHGEPGATVNDKLMRLLLFLGAVRDADAATVTAMVPYLCYARKDRRTKPRDPVSTRYVAQLFEAMGVDRVVVVDVHNDAAFENAFRCRVDLVEARPILVDEIVRRLGGRDVTVVSPDVGGSKRADKFAATLAQQVGRPVPVAFLTKRRSEGVVSGSDAVVGDVMGRVALIVDDLIASGGTIARAADSCRREGAAAVMAAATHALFTPQTLENLSGRLDALVVTDTVVGRTPPPGTTIVPIAPRLADVVRRLHNAGSLVNLQEDP